MCLLNFYLNQIKNLKFLFVSIGQCGYDLCRHSFAIKPLTKPSIDHLLNFFSHRIPQVWNKLAKSVESAPTFTAFKKHLKAFDLCLISTMMYS